MLDCRNEDLSGDIYKCVITVSREYIEETGYINTYGIDLYNADPFLAARRNESCRIDCISEDFEKIMHLKKLIDELGLYPVHLRDVVEDFLT